VLVLALLEVDSRRRLHGVRLPLVAAARAAVHARFAPHLLHSANSPSHVSTMSDTRSLITDRDVPGDRAWEDFYRNRWQHDKIVRSTHGVNCTGGCTWQIYVKTAS
jgi:hypothetical protein